MGAIDKMSSLMRPLTDRNEILREETPQEKINRLKARYGLHHGKGKRKKQKNKNKKKK